MQADMVAMDGGAALAASSAPNERADDAGSKFLTFEIADRTFAVEVLMVREILDAQHITPLPNSPHQVEGVVDVRGASIPIINVSATLGAASDPLGEDTRIIVFETREPDGPLLTIGILADRVRDVCQIEPDEIETPPDFGGAGFGPNAVNGLCRLEDDLVVIIDLAKIVADMGFSL